MKIIRKNKILLAIVIVLMLSVFSIIPQMAIADNDEICPTDAGANSGNNVVPELYTKCAPHYNHNPTCSDLGYSGNAYPIEPVIEGEYNDPNGPLSVKLTVTGNLVDWTSNIPVKAVIVKGGPCANLFDYGSGSKSDTSLHAPVDDPGPPVKYYGLSHIDFCYSTEGLECPTCSIAPVEAVCEDDSVVFSLDATIDPGDYTEYNLSWSDGGAGGTFSNPTDKDTTWTPPADFTGIATLTLTVTADGCEESKCTVDVTVYPNPDCSITPVDPICAGESVELDATVTGGTSPYEYSWSSDSGGTFSDSTIEDPTWTSPTDFTGIATLTLTVTDSKGCTTTCFVDVTVDPCEEPKCPTCSIAPVEAVCEDDSVVFSLDATIDPGDYTEYNLSWSDGGAGGTFSNPTDKDTTWTPPADFTGIATLTLTVTADGCEESKCTVDVTVYPNPDCSITAPDSVCDETTGNIASTTVGYSSYIWLIANGTITSGQGTNKITFSVTPGVTFVTIGVKVVDSNGCENYCSVNITVDPCERRLCKCSLVVEKRDETGNAIDGAVFEVDGVRKTIKDGKARWDNLECDTTYEVRELSPIEQTERIRLGDCGERSTMRVINKIEEVEEGELEVLGIMEVLPFTGPAIPYSPFIGISTVLAGTFLYILSKPKKKR